MAFPSPRKKTPERLATSVGEVAPEFRSLWRDLLCAFPARHVLPARNVQPEDNTELDSTSGALIAPTRHGPAFDLDQGAGTRMLTTAPDRITGVTFPCTIGVFVKPTSTYADFSEFFGASYASSDTSPYRSLGIGLDRDGNVVGHTNNGTGIVEVESTLTFTSMVGEWHALVFRVLGTGSTTVEIISNGEVLASQAETLPSSPVFDSTSQFGYGPSLSTSRSMPALLDGGFIADRYWTDQEIETWTRNPHGLYTKETNATILTVARVTAEGSLTDGGETISGTASVVPSADGSVTDGGETVSGDVRVEPFADGSVTDGGETVSGDVSAVPVVETASVTDGGETVSGDATATVEASGSVTEAEETVAGDTYVTVSVSGSVTEAEETVEGDAQAQLLTTGSITDDPETVSGFATNSVGRDKVLLRSAHDGEVVSFRARTLNVTTRMNACDTASFSVFLRPGEETPLDVGEPIALYVDERQEDKIWAGTVDRYTEDDYTGAENYTRVVSYRCVCYSALADRYHVSASYRNELAGDIVRDFITRYLGSEGVTEGTIEDGPEVTKANFAYTPLSQALNDLGDETGFSWFIDEEKQLHFRSRSSTLGDLTVDDSNRPFLSMSIQRGRKEYRNRQIVRGGKGLTEERTETFVGDGESQTFTTVFDVAQKPTIEVGGTPQDVGITGLEDDADFYWNKGSNTISQDDGATPLTASDTLSVTYVGLVPIAVEASDQEQINERAEIEGGQGVYENVISDASIEENDAALERAEGLLRRFARVDERVRFSLDESGVRQGQLIEIDLPTRDLAGEYLLDEVSYRVKDNNEFRAEVVALSGEAYGGWTKFFREIKQAKQEFTVRENEKVLLQRRIGEDVESVDAATLSDDTLEAFIIGADGSTPGGGDSRIGFVRIGDTTHEENVETETVSSTDSATTSSATLEFTIGTDEIGFSAIG